jgi:protein tyrosine/serine phosphatase
MYSRRVGTRTNLCRIIIDELHHENSKDYYYYYYFGKRFIQRETVTYIYITNNTKIKCQLLGDLP